MPDQNLDRIVDRKLKAYIREVEWQLPEHVEEEIIDRLCSHFYTYLEQEFMPRIESAYLDVLSEEKSDIAYKKQFLVPFLSLLSLTVFSLSVSIYSYISELLYVGNLFLPPAVLGLLGATIILHKNKKEEETEIEEYMIDYLEKDRTYAQMVDNMIRPLEDE